MEKITLKAVLPTVSTVSKAPTPTVSVRSTILETVSESVRESIQASRSAPVSVPESVPEMVSVVASLSRFTYPVEKIQVLVLKRSKFIEVLFGYIGLNLGSGDKV